MAGLGVSLGAFGLPASQVYYWWWLQATTWYFSRPDINKVPKAEVDKAVRRPGGERHFDDDLAPQPIDTRQLEWTAEARFAGRGLVEGHPLHLQRLRDTGDVPGSWR